jgi:DNA invertase Pin-like site-specific DNA recombinase
MQLRERDDPGDQSLRAGQKQIGTLSAIFPFTAVMFHIIGAITEFERDVISERTQAGLTR